MNTHDMLAEDGVRFCLCTHFSSIKLGCILIEDVASIIYKYGLTCLCECVFQKYLL